MDRREEIILAALDIAAESGLENMSMSDIAKKLGIQKPSLYNHFRSKDEIISGMYRFLRERAKNMSSPGDTDYGELVKGMSMEETLTAAVANYDKICGEENMLSFYRLIYSRRAADPAAAGIMAEETARMILATKNLFYALSAENKISIDDIDTAALSFAMTVHAMTDYRTDCALAGVSADPDMIKNYIKWFCARYDAEK